MSNIALLEYMFILEPEETYSNVFQFEADLNVFFKTKGMKCKAMAPVAGASGRRIILIEKENEVETTEDDNKDKTVKQQKAQLTMNRGFDGKWRK
jgi:hypothetical protein